MRLENKSIVVTGASAGIGRAIVKCFVQEGANVVAVARRQERLEALVEELKDSSGKILPFAGDIGKKEINDMMIDFAIEKFGRLDVLVNNAGIMWVPLRRDSRGYESQLATNHLGHFHLTAWL